MTTLDLSLYALVDPAVAGGRSLPGLAALIAESATLVQLRDKHGSTRAMIEEARDIMAVLRPYGVPLLVNDRVDVALIAGAHGVHIGWDDMDVADARRLLGANAIIGLSIKTAEQAAAAPLHLLNYVAIGGVYATTSKDNVDAPIGSCRIARFGGRDSGPQAGLSGLRHRRNYGRQRERRHCGRR